MKILIIGKNNIMKWPQKINVAFEQMGHSTELFLFNRQTVGYCFWRLMGKQRRLKWLAQKFERKIKAFNPDLILFVSFCFIPQIFYDTAGRFDCVQAAWAADRFGKEEKPKTKHLNALFCTDTGYFKTTKNFFCPSYYLPLCVDESIAKAPVLPHSLLPFFVGVANSKRIEYLKACQTPCLIYGVGWPKDELPQHKIHNKKISTKQAFDFMRRSVAPINMAFSANNINGLNFRPFEIGACGGLIMVNNAKDLALCYRIGKEAVTYTTPNQFARLINDIAQNPKKYAKIAAAGHQRTLRDHTYFARLNQMLKQLKLK